MEAASPSLRRPPNVGGAASRPRPFHFDAENNDDLPVLLVAGLVGKREYDAALRVYCQLNRRFLQAATDALDAWLANLTEERQGMVDSERAREDAVLVGDDTSADQHDRRAAIHELKLNQMLDGAFGESFASAYGAQTRCSIYSPKVFAAMRLRRCVLCRRSINARSPAAYDRRGWTSEVSFTFAHATCQQKHYFVLGHRSPMTTALQLCTHDRTIRRGGGGEGACSLKDEQAMITASFRPQAARAVWKALAVYHLTPEHTFNPSNLWRSLDNGRRERRPQHAPETAGEVHWLRPLDDLVKREDTLLGALNVSDEKTDRAIARANTYVAWLVEQRARTEERRQQAEARRHAERRGQTLARLGLMHSQGTSPWATVAEIARVHPRALERLGITTFMDNGRSSCGAATCLQAVSKRIVFLARLCGTPPISSETLDFMMDCDEAWATFDRADLGRVHVIEDRMVDFAKFLNGMAAHQVRIDDVSVGWHFKLTITPPPYTVDVGSLWARVHNPVSIRVQVDYDKLRWARAHLEELGCTTPIPNLMQTQWEPDLRTPLLRTLIECALETPLADGTTTRKARHIAYYLLRINDLLEQWRREMAVQVKPVTPDPFWDESDYVPETDD